MINTNKKSKIGNHLSWFIEIFIYCMPGLIKDTKTIFFVKDYRLITKILAFKMHK